MFLLFVYFIEYRSNYYRINIRYTYVLVFCYNVIHLQCLMYFGADTEILYVLLVNILFCIPKYTSLVTVIKLQLSLLYT